jgi:hypothetical protein
LQKNFADSTCRLPEVDMLPALALAVAMAVAFVSVFLLEENSNG